MRRLLISALGSAALVASFATPATAATTTRVDGTNFDAAGVKIADRGCVDPGANPDHRATFRIAQKPKPPYGHRAIGWTPSEAAFGDGPTVHVDSPSTVTGSQIRLYAPNDHASGQAVVDFSPSGDDGVWRGRYGLPADASTGWHAINIATPVYQWRHYDSTGSADQDAPNSTLADFVATHGGDASGARLGFIFGCDGNPFLVDGLTVTSAGETRTYDFEGYRTRSLLTHGKKSPAKITINYGGHTSVTARLQKAAGSKAMTGKVRLDSRPLSSKKWAKHTSFKVSKSGKDLRLGQSKGWAYRLTYAGNTNYESSASKILKVLVRSKVTSRLVDGTVTQGHTFTTTGRVLPGRAAKVVLQRYINHKWTNMKSGHSGRDGTFRISQTAKSAGTSYWRVRVGNGAGNVGNSTKAMKLTTKYPPPPPTGGGGGGGGGGGTPPPPPPPPDDPPPPPPTH